MHVALANEDILDLANVLKDVEMMCTCVKPMVFFWERSWRMVVSILTFAFEVDGMVVVNGKKSYLATILGSGRDVRAL